MAVTSLKSLHQGKGLPDGGAALQIHSPYSQALLAEMQTATQQQLEQALTVGHAIATDRRRWLNVNERIAVLKKTAALMREEKQHLIATAVNEGGKPWQDSAVEVDRAIAGVELCISNLSGQAGEVIPLTSPSPEVSYTALTQRQPRGLVVAVSAFNHPLNLIVHQVGAAVAAGCPCIVKPAEPTPMSCHAFVEILYRAGLPEEYCQVVMPETIELATALVTDPRVAFFSFIGSARVGWMLRSKLAPGTRCALEHGGVAPVIMHSSAREDKVVRDVMKGAFYHAGQVCVSVQRLFIPKGSSVPKALQEQANALIVGDPMDAQTQVGPLIRAQEVERIDSWVQEAIKEGAKLLCGGKKLPGQCYAPTILMNPSPALTISQKEVFGPVLCIYEYDQISEAIAQANALPFAFQAAVYSQDVDVAMDLFRSLDASAIMVNEHTAFRQDGMPFAGIRQSGLGTGGIHHTIADMSIDKMLVLKTETTLNG